MMRVGPNAETRRLGAARRFFRCLPVVVVCLSGPAFNAAGQEAATGMTPAEAREADDGPVRLSGYDLPGLENRVNLQSLEPWDVVQLIEFLAYRGGLNNIVIGKDVQGLTTKLKFEDVSVGDALEVVLSVNNLAYEIKGGIITVMTDAEYERLYGSSFYDQKQVRIVELKYADAAHVAQLLEPVKSTIGTIVADQVTGALILIDTPGKIREMRRVIESADIETITRQLETETETFELQYAEVAAIESQITPLLSEEVGAVRADERTKTLIVTDLPYKMSQIRHAVETFDSPHRQVFIEAKIVEIDLSDEYRLGVNWEHFFETLDPRMVLESSVTPTVSGQGGEVVPPQGALQLSYRTILGGGDLSVIMSALKTVGETRILSNPHVAVMEDQEATIKVVRDEPYAEAQLESGTTNVVGEQVNFIEVGVKLSVTPRINKSGMISMAINPEVSTVVGQYQAFRTVPVVQRAFAETSVMVADGQTIIIAGLIRNQKEKVNSRVPLLGRIPLLGYAFRSESDTVATTETVVFLTPRVITGREPVLLTRDLKKTPKPLRAVGGDETALPIPEPEW
ncbi:MAG: type II secretion system protein GspD [Lentisphaerae bacterium]|nr:type II secretion system protein GspD [Lentisphaerota bacterium]